jgi:hypothetical protein
MQAPGSIPRIYADFNNCYREGRVRLNCNGSKADFDRLGMRLHEGMNVIVSDFELEVAAVTTFLTEDSIWAAAFDPQQLRDVDPTGRLLLALHQTTI